MIRVMIEWHCQPNKELEMEKLLVELRTRAMGQLGYISGETLRSVDDPSLWLVISTWHDADQWRVWETSAERQEVVQKIEPFLVAPMKASIFSFVRRGGAESAHTLDSGGA